MSLQEEDNLRYAFTGIKPSTHIEWTIVTYCGLKFQSMKPIVDEYQSRKAGLSLQLPDHPILELTEWGLPDTRRLLIFSEQLLSLISEILGLPPAKAHEFRKSVLLQRVDFTKFTEQLDQKYRDRLSENETRIIYEALNYYAPIAIPYIVCSYLVCQSENSKSFLS